MYFKRVNWEMPRVSNHTKSHQLGRMEGLSADVSYFGAAWDNAQELYQSEDGDDDPKFFFKEEFRTWKLDPNGEQGPAFHFRPSHYGYLSTPLSEWPTPNAKNNACTLYWDLSYLLLLRQMCILYGLQTGGVADGPLHPFILQCPEEEPGIEEGKGYQTGTNKAVIEALGFAKRVWDTHGEMVEAIKCDDVNYIQKLKEVADSDETLHNTDLDNPAQFASYAEAYDSIRHPFPYKHPIISDPLSTLPLPNLQTLPTTLSALHDALPRTDPLWNANILGGCTQEETQEWEEEWEELEDEDDKKEHLQNRKWDTNLQEIASGVMVAVGIEMGSLGMWALDIDGPSPWILWGRRRNGGRRIVGLLGGIANSS
ncbi:hypothetical protein HDV00_003109 [Rhizophlyctis rosea]|nr:hypothetical protein HDV00_003109 [Rhizophlyctis rosea]